MDRSDGPRGGWGAAVAVAGGRQHAVGRRLRPGGRAARRRSPRAPDPERPCLHGAPRCRLSRCIQVSGLVANCQLPRARPNPLRRLDRAHSSRTRCGVTRLTRSASTSLRRPAETRARVPGGPRQPAALVDQLPKKTFCEYQCAQLNAKMTARCARMSINGCITGLVAYNAHGRRLYTPRWPLLDVVGPR